MHIVDEIRYWFQKLSMNTSTTWYNVMLQCSYWEKVEHLKLFSMIFSLPEHPLSINVSFLNSYRSKNVHELWGVSLIRHRIWRFWYRILLANTIQMHLCWRQEKYWKCCLGWWWEALLFCLHATFPRFVLCLHIKTWWQACSSNTRSDKLKMFFLLIYSAKLEYMNE